MKKLWSEFKKFINRGSVMDLAVGMIIGSAFTAIITALVKNIFTPLINAIPGADGTGALQTVLREAVTDEIGNIVTEALILDWGSVIGAIITFFVTAIVLFLIVKGFNGLKEKGRELKEEIKNVVKPEGKNTEKSSEKVAEVAAEVAAAETIVAEKAPDYEDLLKQIIELLKESNSKEEK